MRESPKKMPASPAVEEGTGARAVLCRVRATDLLRTAARLAEFGHSIVGINTGGLGILTEVNLNS